MSTCWKRKIVNQVLFTLLLFGSIAFGTKDKRGDKKLRGVNIFAMQGGAIVEVQKEHGFDVLTTSVEIPSMVPSTIVASASTTVHSVHLPGENSKVRFAEKSGFNFLAEFSSGLDPNSLQLVRFGTINKQRISYTRPWNDATPGTRSVWNIVAFKAGQRKDGKWVLLPPQDLSLGEYCFSLVNTDENFCFGVDPQP